ncbi:MAG: glycosyltransferase family 39 protein [Maribacter sp.]|nr:glycosyltransferase family 39 protein [Maribacter sp.]
MTRNNLYLTGFLILKFALQFILLSPEYELQRDEFLHLDQANHLAWGYFSVPPVTSWISSLIKLLGNSVFWIKFFPALFGALTITVVWKTIEELKGNTFALFLGATCVLFSALLRLNTLYQPNSLDVLCWTAFFFLVIKYINSEEQKWLYAMAFVLAIGFLNKYNMVFLLLGLFPAVLLTQQRKVLKKKGFYLAVLLALILILPNLIWQYQQDFPVIRHLRELADTQLIHVDRIGFLTSQLLFFFGSIPVIIAGLFALLFYKPYKNYRLFFWSFLFTIGFFLYLKAKDYYAIGLYPVYIAFGAVYLEKMMQYGWKRYARLVFIAFPILFFIPMYDLVFPNKSPEYIVQNAERYKAMGMLRWEDGKDHELPQDFADMLGWKELASKVDKAYSSMPNPKETLVLCDNYGQAGAVNFYSKKGIKAVSFNADYINWFNLDQKYYHIIRVINYRERANEFLETSAYFKTAEMVDSITNKFARERGTTICTFIGAKGDVSEVLRSEIEARLNYD